MLLMIDEQHKEHLVLLSQIDKDVVAEFCNISIEFIRNGANPKVYQTAAQKLGINTTTVQQAVEALMHLFTECSKLMLSKVEFEDSALTIGVEEEVRHSLAERYMQHRTEIRCILEELTVGLPHYHNLEWRLDVQLASRTLHHQVIPTVTMKLDVQDGTEVESRMLQTDPVNLVHLTRNLDEALQEIKTQHSRRILRNI